MQYKKDDHNQAILAILWGFLELLSKVPKMGAFSIMLLKEDHNMNKNVIVEPFVLSPQGGIKR